GRFPILLPSQLAADVLRPRNYQSVIGVKVARPAQLVGNATARYLVTHAFKRVAQAVLQGPGASKILGIENSQLHPTYSTSGCCSRAKSSACFASSATVASSSPNCRSVVGLTEARALDFFSIRA